MNRSWLVTFVDLFCSVLIVCWKFLLLEFIGRWECVTQNMIWVVCVSVSGCF